jgi:hypothetical protein
MRKNNRTGPPDELRRRAEQRVQRTPELAGEMSSAEAMYLLHELQVHQVELEMQKRVGSSIPSRVGVPGRWRTPGPRRHPEW